MPSFGGVTVPTSSAAQNRRTFGELIDELSRPVDGDDPTVRAIAADAIRAAIRKMNQKGCWPWERMDEDIALTANNAFSTVTSKIKKPMAMHFLNSAGGTRDQPIDYEDYERFLDRFTLDITGEPHTYTIPNLFETGQVRWFPVPSSADNARFTFYRVTPTPKSESEGLEIPEWAMESYSDLAWYEFLKRLPSAKRPTDLALARADSMQSFREISANVAVESDRRGARGSY